MQLASFLNMIFKCYLTSHGISIIAKQISSFKFSLVHQCFLLDSSPSMAMPTKCFSMLSSGHINVEVLVIILAFVILPKEDDKETTEALFMVYSHTFWQFLQSPEAHML